MIWKAVATTSEPILLYPSSFTFGAPAKVAKFRFALPPPAHTKKRKLRSSKSEPVDVDPLTWLLANRQIYSEARPIFFANLSLRIGDVLSLSAFLSQTPQTPIKPSMVQSLSFDLELAINADIRDKSIPIYSDFCDGFSFARSGNHTWERNPGCMCPYCFAASSSILANAAEHLTALRELRLRVSVGCTDGPANERTLINWRGPGFQRHPKLYRPRGEPALVCKDNSEQIADFAKWVCTQAPLRVISKVKLDAVGVQFTVEKIEHDDLVTLRGNDRCWCKSWAVDKESIESCGIAVEIKRRLMSGDPEEG